MHHYYKHFKNLGFTLAEVLITLGIIGVVAALTLPSLIQSYRDKAIVAQTKKTYSTFSQLLLLAKENGGKSLDEVLQAATSKEEASMAMLNYFLPYLNVVKNCGLERNAGCFGHDVPYYRLNGTEYTGWGSPVYDNFPDRAKVKLADGTSIAFDETSYYQIEQDKDTLILHGENGGTYVYRRNNIMDEMGIYQLKEVQEPNGDINDTYDYTIELREDFGLGVQMEGDYVLNTGNNWGFWDGKVVLMYGEEPNQEGVLVGDTLTITDENGRIYTYEHVSSYTQ